MGNVIQTNVASINAQRNLTRTNESLGSALQRLSSGFRINSAKDDAAGLQISNRLTSQVGGLNQAARNANDGISLAQTAEGALQETTNILQRIRDLAIQAANGSNSNIDRSSLQREISQLQAEVTRVAVTTKFGSQNLLDGTFGSQSFQVGANANETISVSIGSARATDLGRNSLELNGLAFNNVQAAGANYAALSNSVRADSNFVLTGQLGTATVAIAANDSAADVAEAVNAASESTGVTGDARTVARITGFVANETISFDLYGANSASTDGVSISATVSDPSDLSALADAINQETGRTGITAVANDTTLDIFSEAGDDIRIVDFISSQGNTVSVTARNFGNSADASGATATSATIGATAGENMNGIWAKLVNRKM